jgi:small subunit ribosomal protein S20
MPNTASAKKRLRQNDKRRGHNRAIKSSVRLQIRKLREAIQSGDVETAENHFRLVAKGLDRAGSRGVIHRNAAARTKSRLQHLIKAAKSA